MRKTTILTFLFLILFSFAVFAATPKSFTMAGVDSENNHAAGYLGKYDTDGFTQLVFAYPEAKKNPSDYVPLISDVDGDGIKEIFVPVSSGGFKVYNINNTILQLKYSNLHNGSALTGSVAPTAMLHDADGDGDDEFFYCGRTAGGIDQINGFDFNSTSPRWMWEYNLTNKGEFVSMCIVADDASVPIRNNTYPPKAFTLSGAEYGLWAIGDDTNGDDGRLGFVRVNLVTGVGVEHVANDATDADCSNIYGVGAAKSAPSYGAGHYFSGAASLDPYMTNTHNMAVCDDPNTGGNKVAYVVADCNMGGTYKRGIYALDLTNMVEDTDNDDGYDPLPTDTSDPISSPACSEVIGGDVIAVSFELSDITLRVHRSTGAGFSEITQESTPINADMVGQTWQGEYNSNENQFNDDLCFYAADSVGQEAVLYCTEGDDPLFNDEVLAVVNYSNSGVDFLPRPWAYTVVSTPSTIEGNLGDDQRDDFWLFSGMYSADTGVNIRQGPQDFIEASIDTSPEGAFRLTKSLPPSDGTCSPIDMDNNGFVDAVCFNIDNITVFFSGSENTGVDFKVLGADVFSETLCNNNNQTFFADYGSELGYSDAEQDQIRIGVDCENNGSTVEGSYLAYGTDFTTQCHYNTTGDHTARVFLRDQGSGLNDNILFTTTTADTSCQVGDGFSSGTTAAPDDDDDDDDMNVLPNPVDVVDNLFLLAGATDSDDKDLIVWIVLILLAAAFVFEGKGSPQSFALGGGVMVAGLVVSTVVGFMSPIYMIVLVILALASFTVFAAMRGRSV